MSFSNYSSAPLQGNVLVDSKHAFVALGDQSYVAGTRATCRSAQHSICRVRSADAGRADAAAWLWARDRRQARVSALLLGDQSFQSYSSQSQIAVLDALSSKFTSVIDAPCPHLHITTQDKSGNLYFSNGNASIASAAIDPAQRGNCLVRVKKGQTTLDDVFTVNFKDLADGREGSNFFYVSGEIGFFNVYHAEREGKPDPAYNDVMYSANYHLWTLDLKTMTAKIMDGIDFSGGQYVAFHLGERVFVAIPNGAYSSTAVYEVTAAGTAEKRFDVQGWAFKMLQVR